MWKPAEYLFCSFMGSYYIDCYISAIDDGLYHIHYIDPISEDPVEKLVIKEMIKVVD